MSRTRPLAAIAAAAALAVSLVTGITPARAVTTPGATYFPLTPSRLLDTRFGTGAPATPIGPGASLDLPVVGLGGVPATGVSAVVLNVTATDATAGASFLTVYPAGASRPLASNLNVSAGTTSTNLVKVAVPASGKVTIYNNLGSVSVVADVNGWYSSNGGPVGATYTPLSPSRVLDTRFGTGAIQGALLPGQTIDVAVTGIAGIPATGVSAVVLNVTAIHNFGPESFVTVFPSGTTRPLASSLNFLNGRTVPNLVIARVGANGKVSMYNNTGQAHLVADVEGWYNATGTATAATYFPLSPARDLDTRSGLGVGGAVGQLGAGQTIDLTVTGVNGVPAAGVAAVVLNVTAVDHAGFNTFVTVYPAGTARPLASNLNVINGQTIPNVVMVPVGANGRVSIYNDQGAVHLVADIEGWFLTNGA